MGKDIELIQAIDVQMELHKKKGIELLEHIESLKIDIIKAEARVKTHYKLVQACEKILEKMLK